MLVCAYQEFTPSSLPFPPHGKKETYTRTHCSLGKKPTHLGRNANHHLVLGMLGYRIPTGPWSGCPRLLPLLAVFSAFVQHHPDHTAGLRVFSEGCSEVGARDPGGHQGYHRLQEKTSGSACPNQGSSEGSGLSPCP